MSRNFSFFVSSTFFCTALLLAPVLHAEEEPDRGRLPDGRAFRTDVSGVQMVDYIAELELSIDELTRKVHGLEYELEEKTKLAEGLRRNGGQEPKLVERDLLHEKVKNDILKTPIAAQECPAVNCPACRETVTDCSSEVAAAEQRVASRQQNSNSGQLESLRDIIEKRDAELSSARLELNRAREALASNKVAQKASVSVQEDTRQVLEKLSSTESALEKLSRDNQKLSSDLQIASNNLQREKSEKSGLQTELQALQSQQETSRKQLALLEQQKQSLEGSLKEQQAVAQAAIKSAAQQPAYVPAVQVKPAVMPEQEVPSQRASFSAPQMRALQAVQSDLQTNYNRLRAKVAERDQRYAQFMKARSVSDVQVSMSALRSRRGADLNSVRKNIQNISSIDQAAIIKQDLKEIKLKIDDDLALMTRLSK